MGPGKCVAARGDVGTASYGSYATVYSLLISHYPSLTSHQRDCAERTVVFWSFHLRRNQLLVLELDCADRLLLTGSPLTAHASRFTSLVSARRLSRLSGLSLRFPLISGQTGLIYSVSRIGLALHRDSAVQVDARFASSLIPRMFHLPMLSATI